MLLMLYRRNSGDRADAHGRSQAKISEMFCLSANLFLVTITFKGHVSRPSLFYPLYGSKLGRATSKVRIHRVPWHTAQAGGVRKECSV